MRYFLMFCLLTIVFIFVKSESVNIAIDSGENELRAEFCKFPRYSPFRRECALFKCSKDRARVLAIPCPYSKCSNKLSYTLEEFSKPYPECCAPPVC